MEVDPLLEGLILKPEEGAQVTPLLLSQEKALTLQEASKCLNTLGKDESGMTYAYLKITATHRRLTDVNVILQFRHLLFVDLSHNFLTLPSLNVVTRLPFLVQLDAGKNFCETANLDKASYLQDLILSGNIIKTTTGIAQPTLEYLNLNYNQIYQADFVSDDLPELKHLTLTGNYLFECGGNLPTSIENLMVNENRITRIVASDLMKLKNLTTLNLRNNQLHKLNGFTSHLVCLKYLNLRQNKISKISQFRKLTCLPALEVLIILQNPVQMENEKDSDEEELAEDEEPSFDDVRISLLVLLPKLKRINKVEVTYLEREEALKVSDERFKAIIDEESTEEDGEVITSTTDYLTDLDTDATEMGDM